MELLREGDLAIRAVLVHWDGDYDVPRYFASYPYVVCLRFDNVHHDLDVYYPVFWPPGRRHVRRVSRALRDRPIQVLGSCRDQGDHRLYPVIGDSVVREDGWYGCRHFGGKQYFELSCPRRHFKVILRAMLGVASRRQLEQVVYERPDPPDIALRRQLVQQRLLLPADQPSRDKVFSDLKVLDQLTAVRAVAEYVRRPDVRRDEMSGENAEGGQLVAVAA